MSEEQKWDRDAFVNMIMMIGLRKESNPATNDEYVAYLMKKGKDLGIDMEIAMKPDDEPSHPSFSYPLVLERHFIWCLMNGK